MQEAVGQTPYAVGNAATGKTGRGPYDDHVAAEALPGLADEEVCHGTAHANAYDGDGDALVTARDGHEAALGREPERRGRRIEKACDALCARGRSHGDLCKIAGLYCARWHRGDAGNLRCGSRLRQHECPGDKRADLLCAGSLGTTIVDCLSSNTEKWTYWHL